MEMWKEIQKCPEEGEILRGENGGKLPNFLFHFIR